MSVDMPCHPHRRMVGTRSRERSRMYRITRRRVLRSAVASLRLPSGVAEVGWLAEFATWIGAPAWWVPRAPRRHTARMEADDGGCGDRLGGSQGSSRTGWPRSLREA